VAPVTEGSRRTLRRRILGTAASVGFVAVVYLFVLPQVADVSAVVASVRSMSGLEIVVLLGAAAANLATSWALVAVATPGLRFRQAMVVSQSSTAVAGAVPGGAAVAVGLTYAILSSWGFSRSRSTLSVLVSGLWDNFVKLGLPVLALTFLAFQGEKAGASLLVGVVGVIVLVTAVSLFVLVLHSEAMAAWAGEAVARALRGPRRLLHRPPAVGWGEATTTFRARAIGLVRRSWMTLTLTAVASHVSLYLVLLVTLRDVGVSDDEVSWAQVLAAFAFVRLLTAIPLTPGGVGIVEVGLIGALRAAGGDRAQVVAAVLIFRVLTYVLPVALGVGTYLFWRINTSWRDSAPPLDPELVPTGVG
jgi:uncharacterized membrane protein YbhN (UPF0104 family)